MDPKPAAKAKTSESIARQNNCPADLPSKAESIPANTMRHMVLRVVSIYVVVGGLWIVVSDPLLNAFVRDPDLVMKVSVVKGWAYVAVTAMLLYFLLRRETRHWVAERAAREEAEATTRDSEARFRQLFESAPLPIAYYKLDGVAVRINQRFSAELGYTAADVPTLGHWQVLAHPDENERHEAVARWMAAAQRAVANGTSIGPEEFRITCKNGEVRTYLFSGSFLVDGVLVAFIDITDRKKMEAALQEQTELFRQMAENIDEVFWMTGAEHRILYVSPAYERIWGRSCESLYSNPNSWADAIHPEDRQRILASTAARQPGESYAETYRLLHQGGEQRWVHVRVFPVRDSLGKIYRFVGVADDITEQRKLEEQLRHAQKMEALGTLAGGVAHDFNNILGAITGYAELAKMDTKLPAVQVYHDEILKACERASALVRQILAFSRQQEQQRKALQLWRVVDEATRLLRAVLPATIEFKIELDKLAPTVLADPTQMHQVVMNLCTNAVHAMAGKNGCLRVKIASFQADEAFARMHPGGRVGRYAQLSVTDNGRGIEQAIISRIFEPFFTTKAPGEGTGLGLAVVHGIVQNHEGIITVASRVGDGATFNVYLPEFSDRAVDASLKSALPVRGRGQRILVIDDEEQLVQMTAKILIKLGYNPETETNPLAGLGRLRANPEKFDLVLTDLTMPQMTGLELAASLLEAKLRIPVVMMTGFLANLAEDRLRALEIKEVLLKPVTLNVLSEAIDRVLKS